MVFDSSADQRFPRRGTTVSSHLVLREIARFNQCKAHATPDALRLCEPKSAALSLVATDV